MDYDELMALEEPPMEEVEAARKAIFKEAVVGSSDQFEWTIALMAAGTKLGMAGTQATAESIAHFVRTFLPREAGIEPTPLTDELVERVVARVEAYLEGD